MDKKLSKLLEPGFGLYFLVFLLFACISVFFSVYEAVLELIVCASCLVIVFSGKISEGYRFNISYCSESGFMLVQRKITFVFGRFLCHCSLL